MSTKRIGLISTVSVSENSCGILTAWANIWGFPSNAFGTGCGCVTLTFPWSPPSPGCRTLHPGEQSRRGWTQDKTLQQHVKLMDTRLVVLTNLPMLSIRCRTFCGKRNKIMRTHTNITEQWTVLALCPDYSKLCPSSLRGEPQNIPESPQDITKP